MNNDEDTIEDVYGSSLQTLFGFPPAAAHVPVYTYTDSRHTPSLKITVATPSGTSASNWALQAEGSVWRAALYVAEHIEEVENHFEATLKPMHMVELGAGAGLPGILLAKRAQLRGGEVKVVLSDYPDDALIQTLRSNVARNQLDASVCTVVRHGWGTSFDAEIHSFDLVFTADTLWSSTLHRPLLSSILNLLASTPSARCLVVAALHTGRPTIDAFIALVRSNPSLRVFNLQERHISNAALDRPWANSSERDAAGWDVDELRHWLVWMTFGWASPEALERI